MNLFSGKYVSKARLDGKTAIVTGSNTGIGKITAKEFYKIGARVILACRDTKKAEEAVKEIKQTVLQERENQPVGELVIKKLDLASMASIKKCAKDILLSEPKINILVNNAGVMMCPKSETEDGFEMHFAVNHLGHYLFTCLLLPRIIYSAPARIVTVSSIAHKFTNINFDDLNMDHNFTRVKAYGQSKLANMLFSKELGSRLKGTGVTTYSLHPGLVLTELGRHLDGAYFSGFSRMLRMVLFFFTKTPELGAQTSIYCSIDENIANETGNYYRDCKKAVPAANANDSEVAAKLWDESAKLVGLQDWNPFTAPHDKLPPLLLNI